MYVIWVKVLCAANRSCAKSMGFGCVWDKLSSGSVFWGRESCREVQWIFGSMGYGI